MDAKTIPSKIEEVTVFFQGAELVHTTGAFLQSNIGKCTDADRSGQKEVNAHRHSIINGFYSKFEFGKWTGKVHKRTKLAT